ncbi:ATP-binding protein [Streptomyces microflavus]|uniref:ATP-binding protein n=1 Tax=Streptomyces microflavus TaxID=1919 RepID=UPI0035D6AAD4
MQAEPSRTGGDKPREAVFSLTGDSGCIADARDFTAAFLYQAYGQGISLTADTVDVAQLVVSELVTNARRHAPGPARLLLKIAPGAVQIAVWDTAPALPTPHSPDPHRVGQHGLEIVKMLAQRLDVRPEPPGKRITAHLPLPEMSPVPYPR